MAEIGNGMKEGNLNSNLEVFCRICLRKTADFVSIFENICISESNLQITEVILYCTSIQISKTDSFSKNICEKCKETAIISFNFRKQCEESENLLKRTLNPDMKTHDEQSQLSVSVKDPEDKIGTNEKVIVRKSKKSRHTKMYNYENVKKEPKLRKVKKEMEEYTCNQCKRVFRYFASLRKHQRSHGIDPNKCRYCDFKPETPNKLVQHMETEHADKKTIICQVCGKAFFRVGNLRLHLLVHSGIKPHTCEICGHSFALGGNLAAHRRLHTGEKPFTCNECGRGFTQHSALKSHQAGHTNKKDHLCSECGAAFSRPGALRNHRKRHSSVKPFQCSVCGKEFVFKTEMKRHMIIHTGVKNYVCDICGKSFNRGNSLKVHRKIHTGETPHVCGVCGKGFIQAHCLKTHMHTHHDDSNTSTGNSEVKKILQIETL